MSSVTSSTTSASSAMLATSRDQIFAYDEEKLHEICEAKAWCKGE